MPPSPAFWGFRLRVNGAGARPGPWPGGRSLCPGWAPGPGPLDPGPRSLWVGWGGGSCTFSVAGGSDTAPHCIYQRRPTETPTDSYIDISERQNGSTEIPAIHSSNALPVTHCSSCTAHCSSCTAHTAHHALDTSSYILSRSRKAEADRFVHC